MTHPPKETKVAGSEGRWSHVPRRVGGIAEAVLGARGEVRKLKRIFERSPVPMVMLDANRRYVDVNRPAQLWFRLSLEEMRTYALGDLAPPDQLGAIEREWARLLETGCVAARHLGVKPDGGRVAIVYCALADVLPGRYVIVYAPADWPEEELGLLEGDRGDPSAALTPREVEVLELAADGTSIPQLAAELALSPDTVRTHLKNIYAKLGVHNRTGAVTRAMRLGLIDC
jgi:DNA-binding CsgD family transcriptional regulator